MNGEKANVVFVCHRPAVWEALHGVYDALKADEHFHVTIVAIPNKKELPDTWLYHEEYESEGAEEFWKPYGCVNGYNYETKEWLDLRSLKPDYVFFQQPYNVARPPQYHSRVVSKTAKICYGPYFVPNSFDNIYDDCAPLDFLQDTAFFFAQRADEEAHMRERFAMIPRHDCQIVLTGNPRFDDTDQYAGLQSELWNDEKSFKILWTPRWTTNEGNCFFFAYRDFFFDYCAKHEDVEFVFRPHPQAFPEWRSRGEMSEAEEKDLRARFTGRLHLDEGRDYHAVFYSSDCLVTDKSSMLTDYFFTRKPVVYCRPDAPSGDITETLEEGVYTVYNRKELEETLENLRNGKDPKKEIREKVCREYLKVENRKASEIIRDVLLRDALEEA